LTDRHVETTFRTVTLDLRNLLI